MSLLWCWALGVVVWVVGVLGAWVLLGVCVSVFKLRFGVCYGVGLLMFVFVLGGGLVFMCLCWAWCLWRGILGVVPGVRARFGVCGAV